jgi:hypothetical protein
MVRTWITDKAVKGAASDIAGRGLVAAVAIGPGELTDDEYEAVMLFVNHSCQPNVGFAGNVVLVAMRDIEPGEELTTDYALFDDYEGSLDCACRRPTCRGRVDGRDWQRADLQERYRGYFSWYLERRIGDARAPAAGRVDSAIADGASHDQA